MFEHTVNRRTFLKAGTLGGVAAARASEAHAGGTAQGEPRAASVPPFDLEEVSIAALQERMASGAETSSSITQKYLARIAALDTAGPTLRQVLETNPDALAVAAERDRERRAGRVRGPLHGVPILLKDNIGTADRMTTTAGSLALEGSIPAKDSFVAGRLREAGAILLGKTNMSEWANIRSTRSTSGWSGRGGLGRNPYALDRNTVRIELGVGRRRRGQLLPPRRLAPRLTGRSCRRRTTPVSWGSSRPLVSSAARGSSRLRTRKTPPGRWPAPWPMP